MGKQNVAYAYDLFSLEKESSSDTCSKMHEPWKHYANWDKPDTKTKILYDFTYMKGLEEANSERQKVEQRFLGAAG